MTSPYIPPQRNALTDEELASRLAEIQATGSALDAMDFLEAQNLVRAADETAYVHWVKQMEAEGSAQALAAIRASRGDNSGIPPVEPEPESEPTPLAPPVVATEEFFELKPVFGAYQQPKVQDSFEFFTESIVTPEPQRASDFATGGFDIVETAQVAVVDEFDAIAFDDSEDSDGLIFKDAELDESEPITHVIRRSKAISQLFVWGGILVGAVPLMLGALIADTALPIVLQIVAVVVGFAIAALLISTGAIGGKRSGLQTLMLSRAAFGVKANLVAAIPAFIAKLIVGALLLASIAFTLFNKTVLGVPEFTTTAFDLGGFKLEWLHVLFAGLVLLAGIFAALGGRTLYVLQMIGGLLGFIAVACFAGFAIPAVKFSSLDFTTKFDSAQLLQAAGIAALVLAVVGAFWTTGVADFTRQVPMSESGKKLVWFVVIPAFVLSVATTVVAILVISPSVSQATGSTFGVMEKLLTAVPYWLASATLVAALLQTLVWAASWLYSTSVSLRGLGIKTGRYVSQLIVFVLVVGTVVAVSSLPIAIVRSTALIGLLVLVAFAGIFVGDVWRRKIAYDETSLREAFGFYGSANWVNVFGFVLALIIGLGFVSTEFDGYYITNFIGQFVSDKFATAEAGIYFALVIAILFPVLFGGKRIRSQEAQVLEIERRRGSLLEIDITEVL